jgi:hypothetical protein
MSKPAATIILALLTMTSAVAQQCAQPNRRAPETVRHESNSKCPTPLRYCPLSERDKFMILSSSNLLAIYGGFRCLQCNLGTDVGTVVWIWRRDGRLVAGSIIPLRPETLPLEIVPLKSAADGHEYQDKVKSGEAERKK